MRIRTVRLCALGLWHCRDMLSSMFWRLHNTHGKKASANWDVWDKYTHTRRKDLK